MSPADGSLPGWFPAELGVQVAEATVTAHTVVMALRSIATRACCPRCDRPSERVHSHYRRLVADLPWQGRRVALRLTLRRFRCGNGDCPQRVFCERLPALLRGRARSTARLLNAHAWIGHALGGEAGARLADRLALPTSPDTLLRRVRQAPAPVAEAPRTLGVDDFAFRKGHTYGTALVDLERRRLIDLLPDREAATLVRWLSGRTEVEVVSRDRATAYAQAVRAALPKATQVADRWHLLTNLRDALQRVFQRNSQLLRAVFREEIHAASPAAPAAPAPDAPPAGRATTNTSPRLNEQRQAVFRQVRQWHEAGLSVRQIMGRTGLHYRTVRRYLDAQECPDWRPGRRGRSLLVTQEEFVRAELHRGNTNTAELHRLLQARGISRCPSQVRLFVRRLKAELGISPARPSIPGPATAPRAPSSRALSMSVVRRPEERSPEEEGQIDRLRRAGATLAEAVMLGTAFAALVRRREHEALETWLRQAEGSAIPELRALARSLRQDESAVRAGVTLPWSNGPVEGHINRLKFIKRSMFGRAKFDLLRARVLRCA